MKALPLVMLLALAACGAQAPSADASEPAAAASVQTQAKPKPKGPTGEELAQAAGAPLIGKYAPPLTVTTVDGKKIDLAKLYGKEPVYLKFWATWCVPCRLQMPHFENIERTMGRDMQVVAIDAGFNETRDAVLRYREEHGLTMPIVIDDGRLADALHLRITPQHIVIGRDGRILHVGQLADARLDQALAKAVAEAPATASEAHELRQVSAARIKLPALKALTGEPISLQDRSRPTVVFFFSPWCETYLKSSRPQMAEACRQQREDASRLVRSSGARWLGVAAGLWATEADLADYQREHALPMPLALDETGAFFHAFKVSDVPTFLVLDRSGHIVARTTSADQAVRAAARAGAPAPAAKEL
jgi:thiol-disulfide isomerase/thioredoxin